MEFSEWADLSFSRGCIFKFQKKIFLGRPNIFLSSHKSLGRLQFDQIFCASDKILRFLALFEKFDRKKKLLFFSVRLPPQN